MPKINRTAGIRGLRPRLTVALALAFMAIGTTTTLPLQADAAYDSVSVVITPTSSTVAPGGTLSFTAKVLGATSQSLAWYVDGIWQGNATTGTVPGRTSTITYYAPASAGTHVVKAISNYNNTKSASATVTVKSATTTPPVATPTGVSVQLTPATATVAPGGTLSFTAKVLGVTSQSLAWYVDGIWQGNATSGTIPGRTSTITYFAPAAAGTHTVTAYSNYDNTKKASSTVTVKAATTPTPTPTTVAVTLSPASASTNTSGTLALTASVSGSTNTALAWTVDGVAGGNSTVGTITGSGTAITYKAPAAAGSHVVKATSSADATKSASSTISVLAPAVVVTASPATSTLNTGGTLAITASVTGTSSTGVTWSVDGVANGNATVGTLSVSGSKATYTAPSAAGSHVVRATSVADTTKVASTTITVQTPSSVALALTQTGTTSINTSGSVLFTATVSGSSNTAVTWSVDGIAGGNATVGTLKGSSSRIIYTAPATTGTHVVKATSSADPTRSASVTMTVLPTSIKVANTAFVVNVKNAPYNAKGDGVTDDTNAIQQALNAAGGTGGTVQIPSGTYMINLTTLNGNTGLMPKSNTTISLDPGATLKAKPSSLTSSYILQLYSVSNVNIKGGNIVGERDTHTGTSGEWGMGICIDGTSNNVVLEGINISKCWGDGIYVTGSPSNITVANVVADGNRRQGLSIVDVNGMVVRDSTFKNTSGTDPQNGIDIEPEPGQVTTNIQIFNCNLINNTGGGIQSGPAVANATTATFSKSIFMGNTVTSNSGYGISVSAANGNTVADNVVSATTGYGILARTGATNTLLINNKVTGCTLDGFWLNQCAGTLVTGNTSTGNKGYGINNHSTSGATLTNNIVSGNGIAP